MQIRGYTLIVTDATPKALAHADGTEPFGFPASR